MSARRTACVVLLVLIGGLLASGCAPRNDRDAWLDYAETLGPRVGTAKIDEFVREWGMPHQRLELDVGYACSWHFTKGTRSAGVGYIVSVGHAHEAYDEVLLVFGDDHVLCEWKVQCMR